MNIEEKSKASVSEGDEIGSPALKRRRRESREQDAQNVAPPVALDDDVQVVLEKLVARTVDKMEAERIEKQEVDTTLLPSSVTDKEEIFFPNNISTEDPIIYGKWLIFTNGDLKQQDKLWLKLQNLVKNNKLILLGSSTAKLCEKRDELQGIIKCYTCKDLTIIREAGVLIQNVLQDNTILDFKTNEASRKNLFRASGAKFISKFMLTTNGQLYKRDKLCRWIKITDDEYKNFNFEENLSENASQSLKRQQSESMLLPSRETRKKRKRYAYPEKAHVKEKSYLLCLFCNVDDADDDGLTELDRMWNEVKILTDKKFFQSVFCETYAFQHPYQQNSLNRRTIMCQIDGSYIHSIIKCAEILKERISYNSPIYIKFFAAKLGFKLSYLYTEDKEFYRYIENKWKLLKRA